MKNTIAILCLLSIAVAGCEKSNSERYAEQQARKAAEAPPAPTAPPEPTPPPEPTEVPPSPHVYRVRAFAGTNLIGTWTVTVPADERLEDYIHEENGGIWFKTQPSDRLVMVHGAALVDEQ